MDNEFILYIALIVAVIVAFLILKRTASCLVKIVLTVIAVALLALYFLSHT